VIAVPKWIWLALLLPSFGNAAVVSPKPDAVGVTIYRASEEGNPDLANPDVDAEGIALVSEVRELELPEGESVVEFVGVAETIVPQSARLDSLPGVIAETNFDYKVISPGELIANSIGKSVRLIRTDKDNGKVTEQRARLLSGPNGVLLDIDGKIEALDCSGAAEKLVFYSIPENLRSRPVLSAKVRVNKAGRHVVRLSYLATGFDWSANYVARINADGRTLDLTGWVTLANKQDTSFTDAPVQVIAGNIERDESTRAVDVSAAYYSNQCWPIAGWNALPNDIQTKITAPMDVVAPMMMRMKAGSASESDDLEELVMVKQRDLGDYKLYELPFKSDMSSRQVKQVMMTNNVNVPFEKVYTATVNLIDSEEAPTFPAGIVVRMDNKKERGLGKALPTGNVVVMESDGPQSVVAGINKIKDSPVGSPIDIEVGSTSDVAVMPKAIKMYKGRAKDAGYGYVDMEVTLINAFSRPVNFEYRQDTLQGELSIVHESFNHVVHKGVPTWAVKIPSRSQRKIRYTLRHQIESDALTVQ